MWTDYTLYLYLALILFILFMMCFIWNICYNCYVDSMIGEID